ncbi:ceramidase [Phakopsora pachyrhizi]|uniref:Ceramidase n=1 Tax=Phakopsora pachyrhizi TaxID=170000 RepID=A0AAV0BH73_PHAPC|nr:ceramidase [Phakopsora pachyrhizi]CAH7670845.1 ceramidase [Phakopsora pachyrhizi]CAH7686281.1 ceramidase [Phakopsora pachyrhizi]
MDKGVVKSVTSDSFHVTRWWSSQPEITGFWGPATASIDWCESNYAVTRFIAEFANTLSNLVFVALALFGLKKCRDSRLPIPLSLCQVGIALVGIGSFLFHATLKYEWQLGDELPMIYCCCLITYVAFDARSPSPSSSSNFSSPTTSPPSTPSPPNQSSRTTLKTPSSQDQKQNNFPPNQLEKERDFQKILLPYILSGYALIVTIIYLRYPNPVFHQVSYAFIQLLSTIRVAITLRNMPQLTIQDQRNRKDAMKCEFIGTGLFLTGFLIWNIDNLFCDKISQLKEYLGSPLSFIIEGHAWWHLLTGAGAYFIVVGIQLLSVSLKEGSDGYELGFDSKFKLPFVKRVPIHYQFCVNKRIA